MTSKKSFFEEDEGNQENLDSGFKINKEYAKRFEYNKKREDLHKLKELEKKGYVEEVDDEEEEEEEEEDEDGLLPDKFDERIFETLAKIKRKDPDIYQPEKDFFKDIEEEMENGADDENETQNASKQKKEKPLFLKDVIAKQLLEGEEEEENQKSSKPNRIKTYQDEQEELRKEFLDNVKIDAEDDEDDFLKVRKRSTDKKGDGTEDNDKNSQNSSANSQKIEKKLEEYFGKDETLDENEKFLRDFLLNKKWIDKDKDKIAIYDDEEFNEIDEDEDAIQKQDEFEENFNFRYEKNNSQVLGHSRVIEDSVRKKDDSRKKARMAKEERKKLEMEARKEELKRLKNLKKKEIEERIQKIQKMAGINLSLKSNSNGSSEFLTDDLGLEDDFDPDEYDAKMQKLFNDDYYDEEDEEIEKFASEEFGQDDENFLAKKFFEHDDLIDSDVISSKGGFEKVKKELEARKTENDVDQRKNDKHPDEEEEEEEEEEKEAGRDNGGERQLSLNEKISLNKILEEYYKLDYEDVVGDIRTRFKYRSVKPNNYGLTTDKILTLNDKDLNQYVSLKKIAPYSEKEWQVNKWKLADLLKKIRDEREKDERGKKQKRAQKKTEKESRVKGDLKEEKRRRKKGEKEKDAGETTRHEDVKASMIRLNEIEETDAEKRERKKNKEKKRMEKKNTIDNVVEVEQGGGDEVGEMKAKKTKGKKTDESIEEKDEEESNQNDKNEMNGKEKRKRKKKKKEEKTTGSADSDMNDHHEQSKETEQRKYLNNDRNDNDDESKNKTIKPKTQVEETKGNEEYEEGIPEHKRRKRPAWKKNVSRTLKKKAKKENAISADISEARLRTYA